MRDDIVITGMGIVSPIGCGEQPFWDALVHGRSGAVAVDSLDTSDFPRKLACLVRDPVDVGKDVAGRKLGRASALAVSASREAVASAGVAVGEVDPGRFSITIGTTMGETEFIEERLTAPDSQWLCADHMRRIAAGKPGSIAANVRADLGASGPAIDLYGACAAGNMAIAGARRSLLAGECDIALAGGADGFSHLAFIGFMRLRVMAAEVCKPFDQQRDGLFVGEGATVFVLERESCARARGAPIRARILGSGMTCESYHPTRPHPEGDGLTRATRQALCDGGIDPTDIDYVCAHGTGTPQNDAIEVKVLENCFPKGVPFSSIKALTGHCMGAAAAIEAACCVLSLEHQTLIPTWHLTKVLEPCELDAIQGGPREVRVRHVLNNAAGFGGYNSSLLLGAV
ncbi:MAG: beta-ketoacyl-[acyl-carrier-protein] synthase family protein [Planctomycetes bacterium]|nr:beta-ketoacyl-[acyl-carrier-protein] synthase family protein [Planctomycetota bacterium]